jgi:hypothetical protein
VLYVSAPVVRTRSSVFPVNSLAETVLLVGAICCPPAARKDRKSPVALLAISALMSNGYAPLSHTPGIPDVGAVRLDVNGIRQCRSVKRCLPLLPAQCDAPAVTPYLSWLARD